jgi:hypothetical protein
VLYAGGSCFGRGAEGRHAGGFADDPPTVSRLTHPPPPTIETIRTCLPSPTKASGRATISHGLADFRGHAYATHMFY